MLERIAEALEIDRTGLFSPVPYPTEAVKRFWNEVKADIKSANKSIEKRLEELGK